MLDLHKPSIDEDGVAWEWADDDTDGLMPPLTRAGFCLSDFCDGEVEYRIWVHPKDGSSDLCYITRTFIEAFRARKELLTQSRWIKVERIVCCVPDPDPRNVHGYREVAVDPEYVVPPRLLKSKLTTPGSGKNDTDAGEAD